MAESQQPFPFSATIEKSFKASLTEARLGKYLLRSGFDFAGAMRFYLWNARLSKAFQFPLHVLEVTLRNAIVEHLKIHGAPIEWAFDTPYLSKLTSSNSHIRDSLNKCKKRLLIKKLGQTTTSAILAANPIDVPNGGTIDTNDVVASLSFEFWLMLLGSEFENDWQLSLRKVFPNVDKAASRRSLLVSALKIKDLRNRVAHHEPIFHLAELVGIHAETIELIGMRCQETKKWVQHYSTVMSALNQGGGDTAVVDEILPRCRPVVDLSRQDMPIADVLPNLGKTPIDLILLRANGKSRIITAQDMVGWLLDSSGVGLADLSLTLGDVLSSTTTTHRLKFMGPDTSFGEARAAFYARDVPTKKKPTVLVLTHDGTETGAPLGALLKSDLPPN